MTPIHCRSLPRSFRIEGDDFILGRVRTKPLLQEARSLDENFAALQDFPDPVYLELVGDSLCFYPIRPSIFLPETFFEHQIFPTASRSLPNDFGKPTQLRHVPDLPGGSGILDPWTGLFFAPQAKGLGWYLVGDHVKATLFLGMIHQQSSYFQNEAGSLHQDVCPSPHPSVATPPAFDFPDYLQDVAEIAKFSEWLKHHHPDLHSDVLPLLAYDKQHAWEVAPGGDFLAFYEVETDKIYLTPKLLEFMRSGDYPFVAAALAHERRHQQNVAAQFRRPSEEILLNALSIYFERLNQETGQEPFLWPASRNWLLKQCASTWLSEIAEEEISAHAAEAAWIAANWPASYNPQSHEDYRASLLQRLMDLSKVTDEPGSRSWHFLAQSYLHLSSFNASANGAIDSYIHMDWVYRTECSLLPETCGEYSHGWKRLVEEIY